MRLDHALVAASVARYAMPSETLANEEWERRLARFGACVALLMAGEPEWDADLMDAVAEVGTWEELFLPSVPEGDPFLRLGHGARVYLERWVGTAVVADIADHSAEDAEVQP